MTEIRFQLNWWLNLGKILSRSRIGKVPYQAAFVIILVLLVSPLLARNADANRHSEGLNRWSFLSNDDILSDQLCPNPMIGGSENRIISSSSKFNYLNLTSGVIIRGGDGTRANTPVPNDIWALKTSSPMTFLPCNLKPGTNLPTNPHQLWGGGGSAREENRLENKILFMNISYHPFDFEATKAKLCTKFIKLQFDEEEGVELGCDENPLDIDAVANHIYWPRDLEKRRKSFSIFRNLERNLQNEDRFQKKFFFHIYFTSKNDQVKKCTVQQYELNLSSPGGCNPRHPPRIEDVCGEFTCDELIFPFYGDDNRVKFIWKSGEKSQDGKPRLLIPPEYGDTSEGKRSQSFFNFNRKLDIKIIVVVTLLPLIIFGMLIFSLEIIIYITCLRRSRSSGDSGRDSRSQQILQNSLNLWESIPNRDVRSVSFSPVTTNIGPVAGSESPLPDPHLSTPARVLKSALKKSTEHLPPPPASFFEIEREYPPTYVEAMKH